MKTIVSMHDIHKSYLGQQIDTHALRGISLSVNEGEFVAITGPSGCGKSTLLTIMGLLDSASEGTYEIAGIDTRGLKVDQRTAVRNQHIGYVFQSFNLIDSLTVFENVALPLEHRGEHKATIKAAVVEALEKVGMEHRMSYRPNQISGGQQQRVAIARALVGRPDLILVDEPTGNLDTKNGDAVMQLLLELNKQGATIVMVTHDSRYSGLAHRQIQLLDGKVVAEQQIKHQADKEVA
ncbi:ABC transporter ATP-binding protein [Bowmanella pacifica]|uniref:ABC transporter ATP-binding protein n=1 Tax=Bowmanella pacifica TaxID=502051 RepID=A0A917YUI2_9ALTE|nr:ABC transporter ATP-binding protein [Bowmanella pacifica]GGO66729.1 ABC transporter ATP-binding protein [Bowmanella pacifica]